MRWLLNGEGSEPTALLLLPEDNAHAHLTTPEADRCRRAGEICARRAHPHAMRALAVARRLCCALLSTVLLSHYIAGDLLLCAGSGAAAQKVES